MDFFFLIFTVLETYLMGQRSSSRAGAMFLMHGRKSRGITITVSNFVFGVIFKNLLWKITSQNSIDCGKLRLCCDLDRGK